MISFIKTYHHHFEFKNSPVEPETFFKSKLRREDFQEKEKKIVSSRKETNPAMTAYECDVPSANMKKSDNDVGKLFAFYDNEKKEMQEKGVLNWRERTVGGRPYTYTDLKYNQESYKIKLFAQNLQSGDWIYESACGEGANLIATMEILKEQANITDLVAFGNDYQMEYVLQGNKILDHVIGVENKTWMYKGKLCQGDSSDLSFVPSSMFDLSFTGYLEPKPDPLRRFENKSLTLEEMIERNMDLCDSEEPSEQELAQKGQEEQEKWFSLWVKELIRITKPGKSIVIEEVDLPLCDNTTYKWGGVSREWWYEAPFQYDWDIDVNATAIHEYFHGNVYFVHMRRKM
eukprot:CAMPEP_0172490166 /NCGR_PEP_ID=MMETSP1066-20121228/20493_1 /TAXON_ID=671091 /ORGANISM="Coscinodiscus wailesii, Strain CCMP2513" /LENGTH=344 /DNA_ID=CAMNT_0013258493 /DNA_START=148 /DNA_END=1182 /DNA_ORIENTATION=-